MSVREVYLQVQEVLLDYQAEWDAAYSWLEDYGSYAEEYIKHGNVTKPQPPKTPLPKHRTTKCSVVANPLKNKMNRSLRRSSKRLSSKVMAVVDPPVEVLVDLTSDVARSDTTALKGALQEISNVPLVNTVTEKSPKVTTIPLKSARARRALKKNSKEDSRISTSPIRRITRSKMAKERFSENTATRTPSDDSSGSSIRSVAAPKKTGRKQKSVTKRISTERQIDGKAPYETSTERIGAAANAKDQSVALTEDFATPKRSLISGVSTQEASKLESSSNTPSLDEIQETNTFKALPSKKQSIVGRQIFSPFGLDSTKKKAQAYENHIAQLAKISPVVTRTKNTSQSVAKRKSSGVMAGDRLSFAKAAKMSETQRRSSIMRYHLRVSTNQVIRKLSAEKRRSSAGPESSPADKRLSIAVTPSSSVVVEHAIDTIDELESPPNRDLEKDSNENDDQFKSCQEMESEVLVDKLDPIYVASERKSNNDQFDVITTKGILMKPANVIVHRLSAEDIAKHVTKTLLQASPSPPRNLSSESNDETASTDSFISADEAEEEVANMQLSTPLMSQPVKKKIFRPGKLIIRTNQLLPGSEPRPPQQSRAAYLASMLNSSSSQSFGRAFGSTGSAFSCGRPIASFLGNKLAGRPPSFASAQKHTEKLREELIRKQEKEEQALKRRELLLKNKVLNHKKKLDERLQKAAEKRLLKEREQQDKNRALEVHLQQAEEKKRAQVEKKREELEQKRILRAKKEAEMEERRKQEEAAKLAKQREQEELEKIRMQEQLRYQQEQEKVKAMIQQHNSSLQKKAILNCTVTLEPEVLQKSSEETKGASANMNQTYYCEKSVLSENNYDITPHRSEMPVVESRDPENYDIGDLNSEDETDNEDSPRKKIPNWAQGNLLKTSVLKQILNPPDLDKIFPPMPSLDISQVFKNSKLKKRLIHRTSSAIWTSPISTL